MIEYNGLHRSAYEAFKTYCATAPLAEVPGMAMSIATDLVTRAAGLDDLRKALASENLEKLPREEQEILIKNPDVLLHAGQDIAASRARFIAVARTMLRTANGVDGDKALAEVKREIRSLSLNLVVTALECFGHLEICSLVVLRRGNTDQRTAALRLALPDVADDEVPANSKMSPTDAAAEWIQRHIQPKT